MNVIENILQMAKQNGMNDQDLCKALGLSKSGIYHWKNYKGEPSATQLIMLSKLFNVSIDYLLGLTSNPQINK